MKLTNKNQLMDLSRVNQFESVMADYEKALWRVVLTFESDPTNQADLFQDILLAIWKSLAQFKGRSDVKTYVYRIAYNTSFKYVEKQTRRPTTRQPEDELICDKENPQQLQSSHQQSQLLAYALRKLPLDNRQLVALSLEGLSYPEISEITGMTANNVGVNLYRARQQLKQLME